MSLSGVPAAKTTVPPLPAGYVSRPRLLAGLDEAADGHLVTVVSAPPGYGKTLLLAEWSARHAESTAWVSLDEDDNPPAARASRSPSSSAPRAP